MAVWIDVMLLCASQAEQMNTTFCSVFLQVTKTVTVSPHSGNGETIPSLFYMTMVEGKLKLNHSLLNLLSALSFYNSLMRSLASKFVL